MKSLFVSVYKDCSGYDCTNNGITNKYDSLTMIEMENNETIVDVHKFCKLKEFNINKVVVLIKDICCGEPNWYCEPLVKPTNKSIQMNGGNFVYSCDSRFPRINGVKCPIKVHDRFETQEEYNSYI